MHRASTLKGKRFLLCQAQYFRDPAQLSTYLSINLFLASVNNEIPVKNFTYRDNLASLETFVLILFSEDKTVVPKESAWFGSEAPPDPDDDNLQFSGEQTVMSNRPTIIPLRLHPIYTEDWIGLRQLDEEDRLVFETCDGEHMHIRECAEPIIKRFCGGELYPDQ